MSAKMMHELKEMLCDELDVIVKEGQVTKSNISPIKDITTSILNIIKIKEREEEGYSYGGNWNATGRYSNNGGYSNNMSGRYSGDMNNGSYDSGNYSNDGYSGRSMHYVRGHYSRADGETGMITNRIEEMMREGNMSEEDRKVLRRAMAIIGQ